MVDSYPRTSTDVPQYYNEDPLEDPGDVVKSKPSAFNAQVSGPESPSQTAVVADIQTTPQPPQTPTAGNITTPTTQPMSLDRQDSEIQVLTSLDNKFEDSTAAILRHYTPERNGRPASFHLSSSGRPRDEPAMTDIFRVAGKECMVTLEDDLIKWSRRIAPGKQSSEWVGGYCIHVHVTMYGVYQQT